MSKKSSTFANYLRKYARIRVSKWKRKTERRKQKAEKWKLKGEERDKNIAWNDAAIGDANGGSGYYP